MILSSIRRIFASVRTEEDEKMYSRKAVCFLSRSFEDTEQTNTQFFNLLGFLGSCVLFSFVAQKMARQPRDLAALARL